MRRHLRLGGDQAAGRRQKVRREFEARIAEMHSFYKTLVSVFVEYVELMLSLLFAGTSGSTWQERNEVRRPISRF